MPPTLLHTYDGTQLTGRLYGFHFRLALSLCRGPLPLPGTGAGRCDSCSECPLGPLPQSLSTHRSWFIYLPISCILPLSEVKTIILCPPSWFLLSKADLLPPRHPAHACSHEPSDRFSLFVATIGTKVVKLVVNYSTDI